MRKPNAKEIAFIRRQAYSTFVAARCSGIYVDFDDLVSEGLLTFVRAARTYQKATATAVFSTYLHSALANCYTSLLRAQSARRSVAHQTVVYDEERHAIPVGEAVDYADLVAYYSAFLETKLDKEVFREMVDPSSLTQTLATMQHLRANHLVKCGVHVGASKSVKSPQVTNPEIIARSLRLKTNTVKNSIQRIRRIIRTNIASSQL